MKNIILQFLLTIFFLFISPISLISQTHHDPNHNHERCGTMEYLKMLEKEYPEIIENRAKIEAHTQKVIEKNRNSLQKVQDIITIPVVVHVVYYNNEQNISDAQIFSQIAVLNEDFRRLNADASNTPADFLPVAADSEIEFCLATRDPDGNPTTGITRTQSSKSSIDNYNSVKFSSQGGIDAWDIGSYLNIWICDLDSGPIAISQFPGGPASTDGIVCDYKYVGNIGHVEAPRDLGRTMTHEVGHWLHLYHTWGDGDCNIDDLVADTPTAGAPTSVSSPCTYPGANTCDDGIGDLPDMFQNYMDYSGDACQNLFTLGQKDRMRALFEPGGFRESILSSTGCVPLPAHCSNNIQDNGETDIDCGGSNCLPCVSCNDDIQNGEEAGIDCGGSDCMPCSGCTDSFAHNYSAISGIDDGSCMTCSDNIQNADETGIDCGGSFCLPCRTDALELSCGATVTGSANSNTNENIPIPCEDEELLSVLEVLDFYGEGYYNNGVWVSFIGTGDITFLSTNHAGTNSDFFLQVLVESGDDLICVAWSISNKELNFVSELGATYYVYLSDTEGIQGNFELSMECVPNLCSNGIQDGDETGVDCGGAWCMPCIEDALEIGCGDSLMGSANSNTYMDFPILCENVPYPYPNNGSWFSFIGTGELFVLSTKYPETSSLFYLQVFVADGEDFTCIEDNDRELFFASELGVIYYMYVSDVFLNAGDFKLSMECLPHLCSNGLQDGNEAGVDCGGSWCDACGDLCVDALNIAPGDTLIGSTNNSSNEDLPTLCGEDVFLPNRGIWFTFEGTGGEITLSTDHAGTNYDTNLQLYSGDCNDLVCITGDEVGGETFVFGLTSEITFISEIGTVYYLYLSGFAGEQGDFELSLSANSTTLPINISHNRVCDVPSEGQSQVTVTITGGTAPYQVSGNFNGEVEENEPFVFILDEDDTESSYEIIVVDADGNEAQILETDLLPCTKLPVELLVFEGKVQTDGNLLQWTTASELNNQHFRLSYSVNGQTFLPLQKIVGNGTTSTANHYEFLHRNTPKGTTYYQLSQTDFDGTTKNLGTISLKRGETTGISSIEVYPTPTNAQLNIAYNFVNTLNAATLKVYDLTGRVVKSQRLDSNETSFQLKVNDLTTGTYILRIENGLEMLTTKFVKF